MNVWICLGFAGLSRRLAEEDQVVSCFSSSRGDKIWKCEQLIRSQVERGSTLTGSQELQLFESVGGQVQSTTPAWSSMLGGCNKPSYVLCRTVFAILARSWCK